MERLPELSGLSHADKDHLIHFLWESLGELREELSELRAAVQWLETEKAAPSIGEGQHELLDASRLRWSAQNVFAAPAE